jgi:hypothetical protein
MVLELEELTKPVAQVMAMAATVMAMAATAKATVTVNLKLS